MKKSFLFIVLVSLFLINCKKNSDVETEEYNILSGACGTIRLIDNIGNTFNSALDSLVKLREPILTGGCPITPCYNYYIDVDTLSIDFHSDNRDFVGIIFKNTANNLSIIEMADVIDTYGNHYNINWCND